MSFFIRHLPQLELKNWVALAAPFCVGHSDGRDRKRTSCHMCGNQRQPRKLMNRKELRIVSNGEECVRGERCAPADARSKALARGFTLTGPFFAHRLRRLRRCSARERNDDLCSRRALTDDDCPAVGFYKPPRDCRAQALEKIAWSHPRQVWSLHRPPAKSPTEPGLEPSGGRFWASAAVTAVLLRRTGGFHEIRRATFDQEHLALWRSAGGEAMRRSQRPRVPRTSGENHVQEEHEEGDQARPLPPANGMARTTDPRTRLRHGICASPGFKPSSCSAARRIQSTPNVTRSTTTHSGLVGEESCLNGTGKFQSRPTVLSDSLMALMSQS